MSTQPKYRDIPFFLIAIAFISGFNYYLTYTYIRFDWYTLLRYTLDTLTGYLAWWAVRAIVIYLDKKIPYGARPLKRILIQFFLTTLAGISVIIVTTELLNFIVTDHPVPMSFYLYDLFIISIWFFVINGIYVGMHYYAELRTSETLRKVEKQVRISGFSVKHGKQNLMIPFEDIFGFYTDEGYTTLLTRENKKYLPDRSLDKIAENLPGEQFFRLNRQFILHRDVVAGYKRAADGKLEVWITPSSGNLPDIVQVSRLRAAAFKAWFEPETDAPTLSTDS